MDTYKLDKHRIRLGFDRAAAEYDEHAVLQHEVRTRLLERLDYVAIEPGLVIDIGTATGKSAAALAKRYAAARVIALDASIPMLQQTPAGQQRLQRLCADGLQIPLADEKADLLFSNLMLAWCDDLDATLAEFRRIATTGGLVSLSTYGPDTLSELRRAWYKLDHHQHVHGFIDMHDIGDALVRSGFTEPVMDVERFTLTYTSVRHLLVDLRRMGSLNALPQRPSGLSGSDLLDKLEAAYDSRDSNGRLNATFEVIYGHAWAAQHRDGLRDADGLVRIPPGRIGRRR